MSKRSNCSVLIVPLFVLLTICSATPVQAQLSTDIYFQNDSLEVPYVHSPAKATLLSTVLPGAGQYYNKQYWKLPVLYGAFAGLIYLIDFNSVRFNTFKRAYIQRADGDSTTIDSYVDIYSQDNLFELQQFYRRNRDLSIAGLVLVYVLNIVDAHVFAHLYDFDVGEDLSLQVTPHLNYQPHSNFAATQSGISLKLRF